MSIYSFLSSLSILLWGITGLDPQIQYSLSADSSLHYWIPWVARTHKEPSPLEPQLQWSDDIDCDGALHTRCTGKHLNFHVLSRS